MATFNPIRLADFLQGRSSATPVSSWDGETTAAPFLRELRALRQGNQGLLNTIQQETGEPQTFEPDTPTGFQRFLQERVGPESTQTYGREEEFNRMFPQPAQPPQPPMVSSSDPDTQDWQTPAQPQPPLVSPPMQTATPGPDPDAIMRGAREAHVQNNIGPWDTTTTHAPLLSTMQTLTLARALQNNANQPMQRVAQAPAIPLDQQPPHWISSPFRRG